MAPDLSSYFAFVSLMMTSTIGDSEPAEVFSSPFSLSPVISVGGFFHILISMILIHGPRCTREKKIQKIFHLEDI